MCEDELICDLAETYGIYDYTELPPSLVATLTAGLGENSRVIKKLSGQRLTLKESLLALMVDELNMLLWQRSGKGSKPKSIYKKLTEPPKPKEDLEVFESPEDFERWYKEKHNNG